MASINLFLLILCPLIVLLVIVTYVYIIKRMILNAISARNIDFFINALGNNRVVKIIRICDLETQVLDLLFNEAAFSVFIKWCEALESIDNRCRVLREGVNVTALDIETIIEDGEARVRSLGIYAVSGNDGFKYKRFADEKLVYWLNMFLDFTEPRLIIGHNITNHDLPLLLKEGAKINIPVLDTLTLALIALPASPSYSLEFLAKLLKIKYKPHEPDEDAYASFLLALKLIGILKHKKLFDILLNTNYGEIYGLGLLNELYDPEPIDSPIKLPMPKIDNKNLIITASSINTCCENVWIPRKLNYQNAKELLRNSSGIEKIVLITVLSAIMDGFCDCIKLLNLFNNFKYEFRSILEKLMDKISYTPSINSARIVPAEYIKDFTATGGRTKNIVVDGFYACVIRSGLSINEFVKALCKLSNNVYALSFAPHLVSKHGIYAKKMDLPRIKIVKNCNVSSRNLNYIYGFVLRLYDELTKVYAVSKLSKIACKILGIRDINIVGAERIIVPLFHDIVIAAKDFDLKPIEYIVALRELYREKELWIIQKGSYLVKAGLDVEEIEITPYKIDIQIFPAIFSKRVQAIEHVDNIVKNFWGFELRPYQKRAILHILQPYIEHLGYKDPLTIVILPTGSGKSVIFQSSSLALNSVIGGTTIVFSPLLALIEDQIYGLKRRGIDVCRIDSTVSRKDKLECIKRGLKGEVPLIYMTPEQLRNPEVLRLLFEGEINYIVFDEAHCITKWGKTFRPAYLYAVKTIRELREKGLWLPIAMFTATLPKIELNNILRELGVKNALILELDIKSFNLMEKLPDRPRILKGPVLRSNIEIFGFTIKEPSKRPSLLARTVKDLIVWSDKYSQDKPWIGIVFTSFVKSSREYENAEYLAKYLSKFLGEKVAVFHGQLSKGTKEKIINEIYRTSRGLQREPRIIVATKAFGLGVDIPNIRWIVHYLISESVEDYYQEIGRAGRDGDISKAVLLYIDEYDYSRRVQLIKSQLLKPSIVLSTWNLLKDLHTLVRSKTIIVPATLLRSRLFKIIHKLYGRNRSDLAITELCETLGEKALHVLSLAKTIDYEVVSGWASLCNDGYPVGRDPITNEIVRLCIGTRGETVKLDPLNLTVRYSGITIGGYDKYFIVTVYNNRLPWTKIIDEVSRYAFEEFFRLSTAINLAKIIVKGNTYEIRNFIKRYLELGITGLSIMHTRTLLEKIMKNAINEKTILQYYEMPNGNIKITIKLPHGIKYMGREKAKEIRARALAYGIMTAILRTRTPPDLTVAIVPYGYVMKTRESLKKITQTLKTLLSLDPYIISYTMKNKIIDKNSLQKIIKIIKERDPVMIIVATYEWREHITKIVDKVINKDSFYRRKIVSITLSN